MKKPGKISNSKIGLIEPDESISAGEFYRHYSANSERWEKAFSFLSQTDLASIRNGRYELDGEELYAMVSEYSTRNEEDVLPEAHRIYADIQYVISGAERMGIASLSTTEEVIPYDEAKDICFLKAERLSYRLADSKVYFVFFPDDVHEPGLKAGEIGTVKKVVIKVKI